MTPLRAAAGANVFSGFRYLSGSASKLARHPAEQKWKVCPWCSARCSEVAGSTLMPQTGSVTRAASATAASPWP